MGLISSKVALQLLSSVGSTHFMLVNSTSHQVTLHTMSLLLPYYLACRTSYSNSSESHSPWYRRVTGSIKQEAPCVTRGPRALPGGPRDYPHIWWDSSDICTSDRPYKCVVRRPLTPCFSSLSLIYTCVVL